LSQPTGLADDCAPTARQSQKTTKMGEETGMIRPFLLSLALSCLGANAVAADPIQSDVSTWRWSVSVILDRQREADAPHPAEATLAFVQRYERYSVNGSPEADRR
jgi:hypothetical protein